MQNFIELLREPNFYIQTIFSVLVAWFVTRLNLKLSESKRSKEEKARLVSQLRKMRLIVKERADRNKNMIAPLLLPVSFSPLLFEADVNKKLEELNAEIGILNGWISQASDRPAYRDTVRNQVMPKKEERIIGIIVDLLNELQEDEKV